MFKTSKEVRCHVRVHTGAKPHSCRHCSERFMWLSQLKRHLLESHMKALGSLVTFVRRNLSTVVALRHTYCDMKVWSRMFGVNVQSVSIHHVIWNIISWYTQTSEALPAVYVLKVSSINDTLWYTLRDVLLASVLVTCNVCISIGVNFLQIVGGLMALSFPSPSLPSPSLSSLPLPSLPLSLEVGPLKST